MLLLNMSLLLLYAKMAPPAIAELFPKLLVSVKFSEMLSAAKIAPPKWPAELLNEVVESIEGKYSLGYYINCTTIRFC